MVEKRDNRKFFSYIIWYTDVAYNTIIRYISVVAYNTIIRYISVNMVCNCCIYDIIKSNHLLEKA